MTPRFRIRFYNKAAQKDYRKLDPSTKRLVDAGIARLALRANEIGTPLMGPLKGFKKLKWRNRGIRMIFRILEDETIEIVEILAIGNRDKSDIYETAERRFRN